MVHRPWRCLASSAGISTQLSSDHWTELPSAFLRMHPAAYKHCLVRNLHPTDLHLDHDKPKLATFYSQPWEDVVQEMPEVELQQWKHNIYFTHNNRTADTRDEKICREN